MTESSPSLSALADRITDLERSNRKVKTMLSALVVAACALFTVGMGGDQIIKAKAIHLLDDDGQPRVLLSVRAGLSMLDAKRRPRVVLSVDNQGPGLALYGESSKVGMIANVNGDGPALTMRDNQGRTRAMLAAIDEGPGLILWDDMDRESVALVSRNGGSLTLVEANGAAKWRAP